MSPPKGSPEWYQQQPRRRGPGAPRAAGRRPFGTTWWGQAWVQALEGRAQLDPNRLPRGRTYARSGAVGDLTLAPGEVLADVQGTRRAPYKVRVRVRPFDPPQWDRVLDTLAAEIGHTASLLDGELPAGVADDVRSLGLDLLPGPGELQPRCTCPDWADPCKHAAAVCYLVADAIDTDPFGVFLLRGRSRQEVLAGLRSRRHLGSGLPATSSPALSSAPAPDQGLLAREAWGREVAPLPGQPPAPRRPGRPVVLAADPPPDAGVDLGALGELAADAAARALRLLQGAPTSGLELTEPEDLARRAADLLDADQPRAGGLTLDELARRAGVPRKELFRQALAYRHGGPQGLVVLDDVWDPGPRAIEGGRALLGPGALARRNRLTSGTRQLRLGRDGRWYPFTRDGTTKWRSDGPPVLPPADSDVGQLEGEPTER